jgi:hypothetical protein
MVGKLLTHPAGHQDLREVLAADDPISDGGTARR